MSTGSREDKFTTVRIRKETKRLVQEAALSSEKLWETIDRIVKEHTVSRMK